MLLLQRLIQATSIDRLGYTIKATTSADGVALTGNDGPFNHHLPTHGPALAAARFSALIASLLSVAASARRLSSDAGAAPNSGVRLAASGEI